MPNLVIYDKIRSFGGDYEMLRNNYKWNIVMRNGEFLRGCVEVEEPYEDRYFTLESLEDSNTITITSSINYFYSIDNGNTWVSSNSSVSLSSINAGNVVLLKATNANGSINLTAEKNFAASGNIMSLAYGDNFLNADTIQSEYAFKDLFSSATKLVDVSNLILPANTLANGCYEGMFSGCTSLTTVPMLPATTLANYCYYNMFNGCTSLVVLPALPAISLAESCYENMFYGCSSLRYVPVLNATTMAEKCYKAMFYECILLDEAPELPATTLADYCYNKMFSGCKLLSATPDLPATTLAEGCYEEMFNGCTSLRWVPDLPATTLAKRCYRAMFLGCTSLKYTTFPNLRATTLAERCCEYMFYGCTSLVQAPKLIATILVDYCYRYMFQGCTSLHSITCLATDISAYECTWRWLRDVGNGGTFFKNRNMSSWTTGESGIPTGWTISNN